MGRGGPRGRALVVVVTGVALALWGAACGETSPVMVSEAPSETTVAAAPEVADDDPPVTVSEASSETTVAAAPELPDDDPPTDEALVRGLLKEFVEGGQSVGVVVGIVRDGERIVVGHGRLSVDDPGLPDGDTVFEIGSVTKVFTSIALADLELSGELGLDTPVQGLLGAEVRVPMRDGAEIALGHLATHSSGLPRLPDNLVPADWANPYADYTVERLYEFLTGHELARDIGDSVEYSNLGYGLLGHALALREGVDYETLIARRILESLEMSDTAVELTQPLRERLAAGHDERLRPVPNWDIPALAGAGALRSTVNDLLIFLEANLGLRQTPLHEAMERTHAPQVTDPAMGMDIGLGWIIADEGDRRFVWHNGATGGYSSFIGFDPQAREAVVVLSNSVISVDGLAYRLLTHDFNG